DLVCAGVVEVFALEINLRAAKFFGQMLCEIKTRGPADVFAHVTVEFDFESRIGLRGPILAGELIEREDQGFGNEDSAVLAEVAGCIGDGGDGSSAAHAKIVGEMRAKKSPERSPSGPLFSRPTHSPLSKSRATRQSPRMMMPIIGYERRIQRRT